eukprot:gene29110-32324_t
MTTSARNGVARSAPLPQRTRSVCRALDLDPAAGQAPAAADEAPLDAIPEDPREAVAPSLTVEVDLRAEKPMSVRRPSQRQIYSPLCWRPQEIREGPS